MRYLRRMALILLVCALGIAYAAALARLTGVSFYDAVACAALGVAAAAFADVPRR